MAHSQFNPGPNVPAAGPRRVLMVRLSSLGDCLHGLPAFHRLRAALPDARLGWVVERRFQGLLEGLEGLDELFVFERDRGLAGLLALWRRLRGFRADWALDLQGNGKSLLVAGGAGARGCFGAHPKDRAERWPRLLGRWEQAAPSASRNQHAVDRGVELIDHWLERVAVTAPRAPLRIDLGLSPVERALGRNRFEALGLSRARLLIVLLAARPDPRAWPAERWLELLSAARARGWSVVIGWGPAERTLLSELGALRADLHGARPLSDPLSPRASAALFTAAAEAGARCIGADRGSLHLAASAGLPCLLLHGPTDPQRTGPYPPVGAPGSPHRALTSPAALDCRPCLLRRCVRAGGPECMDGIEPRAALDGLAELL